MHISIYTTIIKMSQKYKEIEEYVKFIKRVDGIVGDTNECMRQIHSEFTDFAAKHVAAFEWGILRRHYVDAFKQYLIFRDFAEDKTSPETMSMYIYFHCIEAGEESGKPRDVYVRVATEMAANWAAGYAEQLRISAESKQSMKDKAEHHRQEIMQILKEQILKDLSILRKQNIDQ